MTNETYKKFEAMIAQAGHKHWWSLPASTRGFYDVNDFIAEIAVGVVRSYDRRFDPNRASESTFIFVAANNRAKTLLTRHRAKRRDHIAVELAEDGSDSTAVEGTREKLLAVQLLENLIVDASDGLRAALSDMVNLGKFRVRKSLLPELQTLVRKHDLSPNDFREIFSII